MNGQLGTLWQDRKQIGGFLDWTIQHSLMRKPNQEQWSEYKLASWKAKAKSPWFIERPKNDIFEVIFYNFIGGKLIEIYRDKIKALLPSTYPIGEYIEFVLVMRHG